MTISLSNELLRQDNTRENKDINLRKRENLNEVDLTTTIVIYNIFDINKNS